MSTSFHSLPEFSCDDSQDVLKPLRPGPCTALQGMLPCTTLRCAVLCCAVLCCAVLVCPGLTLPLDWAMLSCAVLQNVLHVPAAKMLRAEQLLFLHLGLSIWD